MSFFKKFKVYVIKEGFELPDIGMIEEGLQSQQFREPEIAAEYAAGFIPVIGDGSFALDIGERDGERNTGDFIAVYCTLTRSYPPRASATECRKRESDLIAQGEAITKEVAESIKSAVHADLIARAFPQRRFTQVAIDRAGRFVFVDEQSSERCEQALNGIRRALDKFPVIPLETHVQPARKMSTWPERGTTVESIKLGYSCVLRDLSEPTHVVRIKGEQIQDDHAINLVDNGMQIIKCELEVEDVGGFTIDEKLTFTGLKFADVIRETLNETLEKATGEDFVMAETIAKQLINLDSLKRITDAVIEEFGGLAEKHNA